MEGIQSMKFETICGEEPSEESESPGDEGICKRGRKRSKGKERKPPSKVLKGENAAKGYHGHSLSSETETESTRRMETSKGRESGQRESSELRQQQERGKGEVARGREIEGGMEERQRVALVVADGVVDDGVLRILWIAPLAESPQR